ncbi:MAG: chorismate synthase [Phycisphaerae bacterium]|jgi:chorismate synthase|nr:chorismate synthase [Phycisphaerae bacterium]
MLFYRTAGESHGRAMIALIEGLPAGLGVDEDLINAELARRQGGFGRGGRMKIETDTVEVLSGTRGGKTLGSPVVLVVTNRDYRIEEAPPVNEPRPGHADLAGALKFLAPDMRNILERASARDTAGRVAAGALAKCLLRQFGIDVLAYVISVGGIKARVPEDFGQRRTARDKSELFSTDAEADEAMKRAITEAGEAGDTLGGVFEVVATGAPPGLGSCMQWTERLSGRLAAALASIPAIKGVEIGMGFAAADAKGSQVHDAIGFDKTQRSGPTLGFTRGSNNAGGLEGGMTNGQPIVLRAAMKPISTLKKPLASVNIETKKSVEAAYERSDVCAVPAASVVGENVVAFEIAAAMCEKFGGDSLAEMKANCEQFLAKAREI